MKTFKLIPIKLIAVLVAIQAGSALLHSQTNPMLNAYMRSTKVVSPKFKESKLPPIHFPDFEQIRFDGKTQAQIDSIKRADKEKETFYTNFLTELSRIADYEHQCDSLEIPPVEDIVTLYSFYDDITTRNDSCSAFMKYHMFPMGSSISNQALHNKLFGKNGLYKPTLGNLKKHLHEKINVYMIANKLDSISIGSDDIGTLIVLADSLDNDTNHSLIMLSAEYFATCNSVYKELSAMRALHGTPEELDPTSVLIKLIEMRLKIDDKWMSILHFPNIDSTVLWEIETIMRPGKKMGRYNERTLQKQLEIWIKNETEIFSSHHRE